MSVARIGGLDALRGLAALAVFVCHLAAYWPALDLPRLFISATQVGAHGVDVFVVLSGFVLMLPLVRTGGSLNTRQFYGRRMWRILPAYWVALTFASVLAAGPLWDQVVAERATLWDIVVHAFALQTVFVPTLGSINGSLWSISLEILLYLFFPLLVVLLHRIGRTALVLGAAALSFVAWWVGTIVHVDGPLAGFIGDGHTLQMRLVQFVAGMVLATVLARKDSNALEPSRTNTVRAIAASIVTGGAAVASSTFEVPQGINLTLWAACGCALVWLFALLSERTVIRFLDRLGTRAYSFYLVHQPIVLLLSGLAVVLPGPGVVVFFYGGLIALITVSLAAEVLFRFVERPTHKLAVQLFPQVVVRPTTQRGAVPR